MTARFTLADLVDAAAGLSGFSSRELLSRRQDAYIVTIRREIAFVAKANGFGTPSIGKALARDQSSIISLVRGVGATENTTKLERAAILVAERRERDFLAKLESDAA